MTYVLPDDWYANHGIPPGSGVPPQPIMQPRPGNLAPTPPIRGYFGMPPRPRKPSRWTVSPFAVNDSMFGLGSDPNKVMVELQKDMKDLMIKQAAMVTGITLALNVIPVAGQAAAIVFSAVQGLIGSRYAKKAQEVVADTQNKALLIGSEYELKLQAAQNDVFLQEQDAGMQLALSCSGQVAALNGIDAGLLGFSLKKFIKSALNPISHIKSVLKPVGTVVKFVAPDAVDKMIDKADNKLDTAEEKFENVIDTLSGERALEKAKEARTKVLSQVRTTMEARYQVLVAEMDSEEYRVNLRKSIASMLLENAAVAELAKQHCSLTSSALPGMGPNPLTKSADAGKGVFGAIAAGAAVLIMMGINK